MPDFYCREILSGKTIVPFLIETQSVIAFRHTQPYWEQHIVVIPKKHIESLSQLEETDWDIANELLKAIQKISQLLEKEFGGCRVCTNIGDYQDSKHLHFYIHSGKRLRNEDGSAIEIK